MPKFNCGECKGGFTTLKLFRKHIEDCHEVILDEMVTLKFADEKKYKEWRARIESQGAFNFVDRGGGEKELAVGMKTYFRCNRSGEFKPAEPTSGRERKKSYKMNATCPCSMTLTKPINSTDWVVEYYPTHHLHDNSPFNCRMPELHREEVQYKLGLGASNEGLRKDIKNQKLPETDKRTALSFQDFNNIRTKANKDQRYKHGKYHAVDIVSCRLRVAEMKRMNEIVLETNIDNKLLDLKNAFLVLADDFQIGMLRKFGGDYILLDSTYSITKYGLKLTPLIVINEYGNGVTAAICVSEKTDARTWEDFFKAVKSKLGTAIHTNVFMTDGDRSYYNAWCTVMGKPTHKLLCTWHVWKCWDKQMKKKLSRSDPENVDGVIFADKQEKKKISKMLLEMKRAVYVEDFEVKYQIVVSYLKDHWKEYYQYFISKYDNNKEEWAHCYRSGLVLTTNNHVESFFNSLKKGIMEGTHNERLDCLIHYALSVSGHSQDKYRALVARGKRTGEQKNIFLSHKEAQKMSATDIAKIDDKTWKTKCEGVPVYINLEKYTCDELKCEKCTTCNSCIHMFSCDCTNYRLKNIMCPHIHLVCMLEKLSDSKSTILEVNLSTSGLGDPLPPPIVEIPPPAPAVPVNEINEENQIIEIKSMSEQVNNFLTSNMVINVEETHELTSKFLAKLYQINELNRKVVPQKRETQKTFKSKK